MRTDAPSRELAREVGRAPSNRGGGAFPSNMGCVPDAICDMSGTFKSRRPSGGPAGRGGSASGRRQSAIALAHVEATGLGCRMDQGVPSANRQARVIIARVRGHLEAGWRRSPARRGGSTEWRSHPQGVMPSSRAAATHKTASRMWPRLHDPSRRGAHSGIARRPRHPAGYRSSLAAPPKVCECGMRSAPSAHARDAASCVARDLDWPRFRGRHRVPVNAGHFCCLAPGKLRAPNIRRGRPESHPTLSCALWLDATSAWAPPRPPLPARP